MTDRTNTAAEPKRECAGCGQMTPEKDLTMFHLRSVGDVPVCCDECAGVALHIEGRVA